MTQQWISVKDKLPKPGITVIIFADDTVRTAWFRDPRYKSKRSRGEWEAWTGVLNNVTHWMPLPDKPGSEPTSEPADLGPMSGLPCTFKDNPPRVEPI